MTDMRGVNNYWPQLSDDQIERRVHRDWVGGMWDEIGSLQFEYLKQQGLVPAHRLLDVGCGALRGGLHFIRYLQRGHYIGVDMNESLLKAGRVEVEQAGLSAKEPQLVLDGGFAFQKLIGPVDYALAMSLFTHLHMNLILRCLRALRPLLAPQALFCATFFEAPEGDWLPDIHQWPEVITHFDSDPYHYAPSMMAWMADRCGYRFEYPREWNHPRNQKMGIFRPV